MASPVTLELSMEEFNELLTFAHIGEYVRNGVLDDRGEYESNRDTALLAKLFDIAKAHKHPGISTENIMGRTVTGPTRAYEQEVHAFIEEYNEEEFWSTLCTRLSHRDFFKHITPEEQNELEKSGWFPESLQKYIEAYEHEFETYGIERLEINKQASIPSAILDA